MGEKESYLFKFGHNAACDDGNAFGIETVLLRLTIFLGDTGERGVPSKFPIAVICAAPYARGTIIYQTLPSTFIATNPPIFPMFPCRV
jgi:hypothetical protein